MGSVMRRRPWAAASGGDGFPQKRLVGVLLLAALVTIGSGQESLEIMQEVGLARQAPSEVDELVPEDEFSFVQTQLGYGDSHTHDPAEVEARALKAVTHTKQAAIALRTTRQAVVRLQQLGDTTGAIAALKAEHQAKQAFLAARATSAPLVAEARANYEATQGTQIQSLAKQVAQDTWRTMTGTPLPPAVPGPGRLQGVSKSRRQYLVRRSSAAVARDYAAEAHKAQAAAIKAQRTADKTALMPPAVRIAHIANGNPAVAAVAKYAQQAQSAMAATQAAKKAMEAQLKELKAERAAIAKANASKADAATVPASGPEQVIANAEKDVADSMRVVQDAATKRGMVDNSWKDQIGDMIKNGQTAEANQAAERDVDGHIDRDAAKRVGNGASALKAASESVSQAMSTVKKAAKKHGTESQNKDLPSGKTAKSELADWFSTD
jgi:hypothetical protein